MDSPIHAATRLCLLALFAGGVGAIAQSSSDRRVDLGQPPLADPAVSPSGLPRGGTRRPSRFDTQLTDLNRNPIYYNYQTLPEQPLTAERSPGPRERRSHSGHPGPGPRFDAAHPAPGDFEPPRFPDDQPRRLERTRWADLSRDGCVEGGPPCTPKPTRKHFDFYS